jgi:hypothetical protein
MGDGLIVTLDTGDRTELATITPDQDRRIDFLPDFPSSFDAGKLRAEGWTIRCTIKLTRFFCDTPYNIRHEVQLGCHEQNGLWAHNDTKTYCVRASEMWPR